MRRQRAAAVSADLSKLRLRRLPYTVLGVSAPSISTVHTPDRPSRVAEAREGGPYPGIGAPPRLSSFALRVL